MCSGHTETSARPVYRLAVARGVFTFGLQKEEEVRDSFRTRMHRGSSVIVATAAARMIAF